MLTERRCLRQLSKLHWPTVVAGASTGSTGRVMDRAMTDQVHLQRRGLPTVG